MTIQMFANFSFSFCSLSIPSNQKYRYVMTAYFTIAPVSVSTFLHNFPTEKYQELSKNRTAPRFKYLFSWTMHTLTQINKVKNL